MAKYRISTASFRQFADKDRMGQFTSHMHQAKAEAVNRLSAAERTELQAYLRYKAEAQELNNLIDQVQRQVQRVSKAKVKKEAALKELQELEAGGKAERLKGSGLSVALVFLAFWAVIVGVLAMLSIYDMNSANIIAAATGGPSAGPNLVFWISALVIGLVGCGVAYFRGREEASRARTAKLRQAVSDADSEIFEPTDAVLKEFQANTVPELLQTRAERQSFIKNFNQANGLNEDSLPGTPAQML